MSSMPNDADASSIRAVDRELLSVMRSGDLVGIGALTDALNVTATAVRQRVERMLERGLIEREKVVAGRGRPTFRYRITPHGRRFTGADSTELAEVMWEAMMSVEDAEVRSQLLQSIALRLGKRYASQLDDSAPLEARMRELSDLMSSRRVRSDVIADGELPILDICSCPYPTIADGTNDHSMCRLEEQVLSEALGEQVHLSSCRLDGDACCQFSPTESNVSR